jgi:hypothetical protein
MGCHRVSKVSIEGSERPAKICKLRIRRWSTPLRKHDSDTVTFPQLTAVLI